MNTQYRKMRKFNKDLQELIMSLEGRDWKLEEMISPEDPHEKHIRSAMKNIQQAVKCLWEAHDSIDYITERADGENTIDQFLTEIKGDKR
jgi:hypothetical protein